MKICKIINCNKKHLALGYCPMHYARFKGYNKIKLNTPEQNIQKGYIIDKDGYKQIRVNGKSRREHRVFMELHIGRKLENNEIVHHINGIKTDNRIINLRIMNFREHRILHNPDNLKHKKQALRLYIRGIPMTKIPEYVPICYSIIYWFIRESGYPIRGIYNRSKVNSKMLNGFLITQRKLND